MTSDPFVVKVQRSTFSSEGGQRVLIYDDSGDVVYETEMTPELAEVVTADKQYMWATLTDTIVELQGKPIKDDPESGTAYAQFKKFTYPVMNQQELV